MLEGERLRTMKAPKDVAYKALPANSKVADNGPTTTTDDGIEFREVIITVKITALENPNDRIDLSGVISDIQNTLNGETSDGSSVSGGDYEVVHIYIERK